jgi:hypothetical protein
MKKAIVRGMSNLTRMGFHQLFIAKDQVEANEMRFKMPPMNLSDFYGFPKGSMTREGVNSEVHSWNYIRGDKRKKYGPRYHAFRFVPGAKSVNLYILYNENFK